MMKSKFLLFLVGAVIVGGGYSGYVYVKNKPPAIPPPNGVPQIKCVAELKACPDGSSVTRVPPLCEFTACPSAPTGGGGVSVSMAQKIEGKFTGSLIDLEKNGGDYQCTFSADVQNAKSTGTVYLSHGDMRGDFASVIKSGGKNIDSHMIKIKNDMYAWSGTVPFGMKTTITEAAGTSADGGKGSPYTPDPNVSLDYDCKPWTPDAMMFTPPANIQFMDPAAMKVPGMKMK